MTKSNNDGGHDLDTHYLIELRQPPDSLIALRKELANHPDITEAAQHGKDFEECIGIIALKLDIALDGLYDAPKLCAVLVEALRNRGKFNTSPHLRATGLMDVELIEKDGTIELSERDRNVTTVAPDGSIITELDTTGKKNAGTATANPAFDTSASEADGRDTEPEVKSSGQPLLN